MPDGRDIFGFGRGESSARDVNQMLFGGDVLRDIMVGPRGRPPETEEPIREIHEGRSRVSLGNVYFEPEEDLFTLNPRIFTGFED